MLFDMYLRSVMATAQALTSYVGNTNTQWKDESNTDAIGSISTCLISLMKYYY